MKKLTPDQIQDNWNKLIQIIKDTFEEGSERRENLLIGYIIASENGCQFIFPNAVRFSDGRRGQGFDSRFGPVKIKADKSTKDGSNSWSTLVGFCWFLSAFIFAA